MRVACEPIGVLAGNPTEMVQAYTLSASALSIVVCTYGATLMEVNAPDALGRTDNIVLRLPRLADYEDRASANPSYLGAILGRYARCIAYGRFTLDDEVHQLRCNLPPHHFHGGVEGFDRRVWRAHTQVFERELVLRLMLESPDGDQGYPGRLHAAVEYRLSIDSELVVRFEALADRPTLVGLAQHAYWNLAGKGTVARHVLQVDANNLVECQADHVPTGKFVPVHDTPLDFRAGRLLGAQPIDHCLVLANRPGRARLEDLDSGRVLELSTDQPGIAVHTGENLPRTRAGVALQCTDLPDAPNQAGFPPVVLRPGERYQRETRYRFSAQPVAPFQ